MQGSPNVQGSRRQTLLDSIMLNMNFKDYLSTPPKQSFSQSVFHSPTVSQPTHAERAAPAVFKGAVNEAVHANSQLVEPESQDCSQPESLKTSKTSTMERRIADNGEPYSLQEFKDYYGDEAQESHDCTQPSGLAGDQECMDAELGKTESEKVEKVDEKENDDDRTKNDDDDDKADDDLSPNYAPSDDEEADSHEKNMAAKLGKTPSENREEVDETNENDDEQTGKDDDQGAKSEGDDHDAVMKKPATKKPRVSVDQTEEAKDKIDKIKSRPNYISAYEDKGWTVNNTYPPAALSPLLHYISNPFIVSYLGPDVIIMRSLCTKSKTCEPSWILGP